MQQELPRQRVSGTRAPLTRLWTPLEAMRSQRKADVLRKAAARRPVSRHRAAMLQPVRQQLDFAESEQPGSSSVRKRKANDYENESDDHQQVENCGGTRAKAEAEGCCVMCGVKC